MANGGKGVLGVKPPENCLLATPFGNLEARFQKSGQMAKCLANEKLVWPT